MDDPVHFPAYAADWAARLGLLPVPLFDGDQIDRSVLLNGTSGNFCLDTTDDTAPDNRAKAWSANVGHYVRIAKDSVEIQRWDSTFSERERYSIGSIDRDLERFHSYLVSKEPPQQRAVIPHVVRVFRQIRNRDQLASGGNSLRVMLLLIACAASSGERNQIDDSEWAVPENAKGLSETIGESEWTGLVQTLLNPIDSDLRLDLELLIRHAAGPVFQEAHREATLVNAGQIPLPGFTKSPAYVQRADLGVGVHFTPPPLARSVVEQALAALERGHSCTVFDPACGSGEFLREALRQIRLTGFGGQINLIGWDISATAREMANFLLAWEKKKDKGALKFEIKQQDSLTADWPAETDLLLMNPPFVSYEQLTSEQRTTIRRVMGPLARGRVEYSNAFIYKAVQSLRKGAVLGAIIPSSFYESSSAMQLRDWVGEHLSPWVLARLGSQVLFPDAIVDAALLIGKINGGKTDQLLAFWADHRAESTAEGLRHLRKATNSQRLRSSILIDRKGFSIYHAPGLVRASGSWSPKRYSAWTFAKHLTHSPTVGNLFNIHTGARSGLIKAFLLPKEKWLTLPRGEQKYFRPAVVNESIEYGQLNDSVYVFYPYGEFGFDSERELRTRLPRFYASHLARYRESLQSRTSAAQGGEWWEMHRPRGWQQVRAPKIVSVQYGDVGSFGWDAKGDFIVVGGYAWLPRAAMKTAGKFTARLGLAYLALLNSPTFFELVASSSRKVRGGQWDLGNKYLTEVPIPNLASISESEITDSLFRVGSDIHTGENVNWLSLGDLAKQAYGI